MEAPVGFTPGPWEKTYREASVHNPQIVGTGMNNAKIATVHKSLHTDADANASLIEKAPQMMGSMILMARALMNVRKAANFSEPITEDLRDEIDEALNSCDCLG